MASESMIERVARAMFEALHGEVHATHWDFMTGPTNVDESTKDMFRKMARAAIEAMREPTEAMVAAGTWTIPTDTRGKTTGLRGLVDPNPPSGDPTPMWLAMIDAALK